MSTTTVPKNESMTRTSKRYREIMLKEKPTLQISPDLLAQITYNHLANKGTEWSGFLFYEKVEGSIKDPGNLVLRANDMYLLDVGSPTYTSFEVDGDTLIDMAETYPNFDDCKKGLIHTHHNMNCFFSGTDSDELQENADKHVYYLSLIVNNTGPWCARIAIVAKLKNSGTIIESSSTREEETGEWIEEAPLEKSISSEEDVLYLADCEIEFILQDYYDANIDKLEVRLAEREKLKREAAALQYSNGSYNTNSGYTGSTYYEKPPYYTVTYANARRVLATALICGLKPKGVWKPEFDVEDYVNLTVKEQPSVFELMSMLRQVVHTQAFGGKNKNGNKKAVLPISKHEMLVRTLRDLLADTAKSAYHMGHARLTKVKISDLEREFLILVRDAQKSLNCEATLDVVKDAITETTSVLLNFIEQGTEENLPTYVS